MPTLVYNRFRQFTCILRKGSVFDDRSLINVFSYTRFDNDPRRYKALRQCAKFEGYTTFRFKVMNDFVFCYDIFCTFQRQSWKKVVGTLQSLCLNPM